MGRTCIVVADQAQAIFYDAPSLTAPPKEVARITDPAAHLHNREFSSDRPGRAYESMGGARHALECENDPRRREAALFARRIARRLDNARRKAEYEDLVVVAGPAFLGLVRVALSKSTRARVVCEVHKDLVHSPVSALRRHLPEPS